MSLKYRPEIDGLRAIAVISVVLYHAEFVLPNISPFKGGFLGVDIFFVISGYLITSIILRELSSESFSLVKFYERRARRILPALFTVMAVSLPFAWLYMLPKAMKEFAGSALSALAFGSNIWFLSEDSYWAEPSALKPFLHTWTLSVEEQFYLFFPLLLAALWKWANKYVLSIFALLFLSSLQLADYGSAKFADASFYLLPMRGWELLAGAILAKIELMRGRQSNQLLSLTMPSMGLFLILNPIIFYDDAMNHPSFYTLVPIIGTMMLIWFMRAGELVTDVLSSKVFVWTGLISYSLYLWHFPVFAFAKIKDPTQSNYDRVELILLSVVMSVITYWIIEKPTRNSKIMRRSLFVPVIFGAFLLMVGAYATLFLTNGLPSRFGALAETFAEQVEKNTDGKLHGCEHDECVATNQALGNIIVVGDSHAGVIKKSAEQLAVKYRYGFQAISLGSCPYIDVKSVVFKGCDEKRPEMKALIENAPPSIVFYAAHWRKYHGPDTGGPYRNTLVPYDGERVEDAWLRTLAEIETAGHTLVVIYPGIESDRHLTEYLKELVDKQPAAEREQFVADLKLTANYDIEFARAKDKRQMLSRIKTGPDLIKVDPLDVFCSKVTKSCALNDGAVLYLRDQTHYSSQGAGMLLEDAERQLISAGRLPAEPPVN